MSRTLVTGDNLYVINNAGQVLHYNPSAGSTWKTIPVLSPLGGVVWTSTGLWGYGTDGFVYQYLNNAWKKDPDAKDVVSLSVSANGQTIFALNELGQLYSMPVSATGGQKWTAFAVQPPVYSSGVYVVKPGDTLLRIVRYWYGMYLPPETHLRLVDQVARANNITNPDLIQVGQTLKMPAVTL